MIKETITKVVPNEMIGMDFENDFMNMEYRIKIEDAEGNTRISSETIATGNSLISRSMKDVLTDQEDTNLGRLKKVIESQ